MYEYYIRIPDAFTPLNSLEVLSLLNNFKMFQFVHSFLPPSLSLSGLGTANLKTLDLSANLVTAVPFNLLRHVNQSLVNLQMAGNVFIELGYQSLRRFVNIQVTITDSVKCLEFLNL